LCDDGIESIGVEELEEPLIAMGLVANRSEVEKLVAEVDQDQNGEIEFSEFLEIIKGGRKKDKDVEGG
jgi:Ca2+-binding EF-hand superfamily protein